MKVKTIERLILCLVVLAFSLIGSLGMRGGDAKPVMVVTGNVGPGTATPNAKLEIGRQVDNSKFQINNHREDL